MPASLVIVSSLLAGCVARAPSNVVAVTVDHGSWGQNLPETTVTICVPGTPTCQTIPHVLVDTASTGLRIYAAALQIRLPDETDAAGERIGDCAWNHWGYLRTADVQLAGLKARSLPIQIIEASGASNGDRPSQCSHDEDYNPGTNNGIIGVSPALTDTMPWAYFRCDAHRCLNGGVDPALQAANVIARFPRDNNGCVLQFPQIPATGTEAVTGHLVFGIGTRDNNRPPHDLHKIAVDEPWGQFKVAVDGRVWTSAFDSGTWSYNVPYLRGELCPNDPVHLCPSSPVTIAVDVLERGGQVAFPTSIKIVSYRQLPAQAMAFNNLGTAWPGSQLFLLGLPYFFGRSIYYAYDQRSGPWVGAR